MGSVSDPAARLGAWLLKEDDSTVSTNFTEHESITFDVAILNINIGRSNNTIMIHNANVHHGNVYDITISHKRKHVMSPDKAFLVIKC